MAGLVEKLVRVVARAFYTDEAVVVLEGMIREKFLKDDEMGSAVNLQTRQVRRILAELNRDHIVQTEALNDKRLGGSSSMTYWYIDYKHFVDVVKYRLYKMSETLKEREQNEMVRQSYRCSNENCGREYTALEAQRLITPGVFEFLCGHCSEPLLECNNNEALKNVQALQKKFKKQMNKAEGLHDGITELLRKIGEYVSEGNHLPSNLPSENRALGVGGESTKLASSRGGGGGGNRGGRENGEQQNNADSYLVGYGNQQQQIEVNIDGMDDQDDVLMGRKRKKESSSDEPAGKKSRSLPEFLQGSTISGHLVHSEDPGKTETLTNGHDTNGMDVHIEDDSMDDAQRKADFRSAYRAELSRYHPNHTEEQVEVMVDHKNWGTDEYNDDNWDEEGMEDIEWISYDQNSMEHRVLPEKLRGIEVSVAGKPKKFAAITTDDLNAMTNDEYTRCFRLCGGAC